MAQAFSPQMRDVDLDWDSLDAMVQEGESGKIVEVEDEAEHGPAQGCRGCAGLTARSSTTLVVAADAGRRRGRLPVWLMGGWEMANGKSTARAPRSRSAPRVVSPRNRTNVAFPLSFSRFTAEEPAMTVSDWISLAGLVVSVIGFSVVIWQLTRAANAREGNQASHRAA